VQQDNHHIEKAKMLISHAINYNDSGKPCWSGMWIDVGIIFIRRWIYSKWKWNIRRYQLKIVLSTKFLVAEFLSDSYVQ